MTLLHSNSMGVFILSDQWNSIIAMKYMITYFLSSLFLNRNFIAVISEVLHYCILSVLRIYCSVSMFLYHIYLEYVSLTDSRLGAGCSY